MPDLPKVKLKYLYCGDCDQEFYGSDCIPPEYGIVGDCPNCGSGLPSIRFWEEETTNKTDITND